MRIRAFSKDHTVIALMLGLAIFFIGLFRPFHPFWSGFKATQKDLTTQPRRQWIIEVAEAVKNPGIYIFDKPPTLYQAIQRAGDLIDNHGFSFDRLAPRKPRPSGRGQGELYKNIYLPYREAPPFRAGRLHTIDDTLDTGMRVEVQGSNRQPVVTHMNSRKKLVLGISIELNEACVNDLAMIPGISRGTAMRIVEFRETHGSFKTWKDLRRVKGVGPRNVEYFRSYLNLK